MPTAKCAPGQAGTPAVAPTEVTLRPASGSFPGAADEVRITSNDDGGSDGLTNVVSTGLLITGTLPEYGPGTGSVNERFTITAKFGTTEYSADPVWVVGDPAKKWPPTHGPGSETNEPVKEHQRQT